MNRKFVILNFCLLVFSAATLFSQAKPVFSGDPAKFRDELLVYMGSDLSEENRSILTGFITKWDSAGFSRENMVRILDLSSQLTGREMRAIPQFSQFLRTLNDFCEFKRDDAFLSYWLTGLSEMLFNPRVRNESIVKYVQNTSLLIRENLLYNSGSVKWKVKDADLKFVHDTVFAIVLANATLTCYSQRDSTEIYSVSGIFFPDLNQFQGTKGRVTWEKAGYPKEDVYADMSDYEIDLTRNTFTCDSARLMHKVYFKVPVYGVLTDQAATIMNKESAAYPRFETYSKHFQIKDIYKGVDYEGGLAFEGANTKGKGEKASPATISLFRKDTLFILIKSNEFVFSVSGLSGLETSATLYLDKDSIFHTNLGFSYNSLGRQVNLFRTNNPVSGSPYYNTFHNLDMFFESMSWDMDSSKLVISRPRGAAMGQAQFQSVSFFNADYFMKLMNLDEYHPLTRLKQFAEWYYSNTFPVSEFAKWLDKSEEVVTGMCIDMANKGFVFYDRTNREVTIKDKINDYIDSYSGKKDYDIISIYSETKAPVDNAILDLKDYELTVNGVASIFISDSQRVAIFPYNQQVKVLRNRRINFDGIVQAGLFTIFGHDFQFSYDTFKIALHKIDSILVAVETDKLDAYGNPMIREIASMIQLSSGQLYIDDPKNKSGLKSLPQYPIIDATAASYIFYDEIPGLEGVYKKKDFYFKVDPFTFENIDHYTQEEFSLSGEFVAGNILKPTRQFLTIQENSSLGFQMTVPEDGIDVYDGKGRLFESIQMSNRGLNGAGTLKYLSSITKSEDFQFFPDSMRTQAITFNIANDGSGLFPELKGEDIRIKWLPLEDKWFAYNPEGKSFAMFENGTTLDGNVILSSKQLSGAGIVNTTDSRVNSNLFTFSADGLRADTADYNLKSPSTSGYAFIAENANTDINFNTRLSRFRLNTDSSVVKFPEIEYICTMTDFEYDMNNRILTMEQKGKSASQGLIPPDKLLRIARNEISKPTFFATNNLTDTISFTSLRARYNVDNEYIEAENINYIPIADALIQPENGKIKINRRAKIDKLNNAYIAVNNNHLLHSASIDIESTKRYSGSAVYDYVNDNNEISQINFPEIAVDTMTTSGKGFIPADQKFMLSPAFSFAGDVSLSARSSQLMFTGSAGIVHDCDMIKSYPVKFKSLIDPKNVMIPLGEKTRDNNDNLVYSGSYLNIDSAHMYPAFLSQQKSWTDIGLINASGVLYYNKAKGSYQISSVEKIANPAMNGSMVSLDRNLCTLSGEGSMNFGSNFDLVKLNSAGSFVQTADSGKVDIKAILALDFFFSEDALKIMSEDFRMMPSLKPVNLNSDFVSKGMKDLLGVPVASRLKEEAELFGMSANMPKEFNYEIVLNEVNLRWNEVSSSFRSNGKIGIGFIGNQPVNVYVDGFVEIQRRRSGDLIDIYLKADESTWYYFSYFKGVMMAQAGNMNFNTLLTNIKPKERKHPDSSVKEPYTYMIAVEDRLGRFLRRMSGEYVDDMTPTDNLFR